MTTPSIEPSRKLRGIRRGVGRALCRLDELANPGSAAYVVKRGATRISVFVVRKGDQVFCYLNSCPHIMAPLNYQTSGFLDADGQHIQCSYHGALFRMEDGACLEGPPSQQCLTAMAVEIRDGLVMPVGW
jgi:nitrite reductase/ring-hydroxylating ferredoxin subunit